MIRMMISSRSILALITLIAIGFVPSRSEASVLTDFISPLRAIEAVESPLRKIATLGGFDLGLLDLGAADHTRWVLPSRRIWTHVDGLPVVGTQRLYTKHITLTPYDRLGVLLRDWRLSMERFQELNPDVDPYTFAPGEQVVVWERALGNVSQGVGSPKRGRLKYGEPLPKADKYVIQYPHRAFGTYYTVSEIKRVFDGFALAFPEAAPVMIGDLSFRRGWRIRPHTSHQTGRDVDITYPRHGGPPDYTRFHRLRQDELDASATLWIVREFVASGVIEYIFMDRWVQRALYEEAVAQGAPSEWLEAVFEYPDWTKDAVVRRSRGHDDHMHIRFYCQPTDRHCLY